MTNSFTINHGSPQPRCHLPGATEPSVTSALAPTPTSVFIHPRVREGQGVITSSLTYRDPREPWFHDLPRSESALCLHPTVPERWNCLPGPNRQTRVIPSRSHRTKGDYLPLPPVSPRPRMPEAQWCHFRHDAITSQSP